MTPKISDNRILKGIAFGCIALLACVMAAATVLEKTYGSAFVAGHFYHSPVFFMMWALAAVSGLLLLYRTRSWRRPATMMIHLSFVLILIGAFVTHISGTTGTLHLRLGDSPAEAYIDDDGNSRSLPFTVGLESFDIEYYPGTAAPMDYISTVRLGGQDVRIAMNRICRYEGYRLYQAAYDEDAKGTVLSVSHDPYGTTLTYTGYALLLLSLIGFFFQKKSGFRQALQRLAVSSVPKTAALLLFMVASVSAGAASGPAASGKSAAPLVLPDSVAQAYGKMLVYYNDRVCPMQTLARDFAMKLYGSPSWHGMSAEQVLSGWIFFYDSWRGTVLPQTEGSAKQVMKSRQREDVIQMVCSASLLKIFPYRSGDSVTWYSSVDRLPVDIPDDQWIFMRKVMSLAGESVAFKDYGEAVSIFRKIREYQDKEAEGFLPAEDRIRAERIYNTADRLKAVSMLCLTAGLLLFVLFSVFPSQTAADGVPAGVRGRCIHRLSLAVAVMVFAYLSLLFGLRWYVAGHAPLANGFEVMLFLAWHTMMLSIFISRRFRMILPFGFLLTGFSLLVASIGESDPRISHLMPVLSSPLLSVHVMCMMISYTLLGLVMLNGVMALVRYAVDRCRTGQGPDGRSAGYISYMADFSTVILYPAVFFLTAGTFLGAVWANVSWGRYWAWDPKEVWALITLLVYAFALHRSSLKRFRDPVFFHWFCVLAFLSVLITYFGVNFILGGLHSYA